jgi:hypothetical protein
MPESRRWKILIVVTHYTPVYTNGLWIECPNQGAAPYTHFLDRIGDWFGYPKGIVSSSPGLAPRAYPGKVVGGFINPNGVVTRPPLVP